MLLETNICVILLFKQKTAYEMRISDWSSDVCSSDLIAVSFNRARLLHVGGIAAERNGDEVDVHFDRDADQLAVAIGQLARRLEIGRASCRERVCQYV